MDRRSIAVIAGLIGIAVVALLAYLALWPTGIDPVAWQPEEPPAAEGVWAPNDALADLEILRLPDGEHGPEDVHPYAGGIVGGTHDGAIVRWPLDGGPPSVIAETGGRPLGLHTDAEGRLVIADATKGLLRLESDGQLTTLCDEALDGTPLVFTDDLDVGPDGTIWFSDASDRFPQPVWKKDILESRGNGRLLRWQPDRIGCEVVADGLFFANGVAVSEDGSFLLINETSRYRVLKRWLEGPRAGQTEVLIDNLPGFPDGISRGEDGLFWIAVPSPRNPIVDALAPYPLVRPVLLRLPPALQPAPPREPFVVGIDGDGNVQRILQDRAGTRYGMVTSAQQVGDRLYLGSLQEPAAAWIRL